MDFTHGMVLRYKQILHMFIAACLLFPSVTYGNFHGTGLVPDVEAASYELQVSDANGACETIGGSWDSSSNTCTQSGDLNNPVGIPGGIGLTIDSGVTLTVDGRITNDAIDDTNYGTININSGGQINTYFGGTVINSGTIKINSGGRIYSVGAINDPANKGGIDNNGGDINNDGTITNNNGGLITNNYNISAPNGGYKAISNINNGGTITNSGTIDNNAGNFINNKNGGMINNAGTIYNRSPDTANNLSGAIVTSAGTINNSGTINKECGSTITGNPVTGNPMNNSCGSSPQPSEQIISLNGATVKEIQSSLSLPSGNQLYIFGMATGGAFTSTPFQNDPYASVNDAAGNVAAQLSITSSNENSFSTGASYYVIGGVGVSGFKYFGSTYGSNSASGARSASASFTLENPAIVIVVALASGQTYLTLNGIPGLQIDSQFANQAGGIPMVIAHADLGSGTYQVTELTDDDRTGNGDPSHEADLIGVFAFSQSQGGFVSKQTPAPVTPPAYVILPPTPTTGLGGYGNIITALLLISAVGIILFAFRRRKRRYTTFPATPVQTQDVYDEVRGSRKENRVLFIIGAIIGILSLIFAIITRISH